ncbi:MAG: hypothetical protein GQ531_07465 [Sulfurovum sp.]|nr:hypothetical protein [Sulfurovum sp.]
MTLNAHKYFSATLAFLVWGVWTYYINIESSNNLNSAMAQGIFSATATLLMVYLVEYFYSVFPHDKIFFLFPAILSVIIASTLLISMHVYIHTYDVLNTVLPSIIISFFFSVYTTHIIIKDRYTIALNP